MPQPGANHHAIILAGGAGTRLWPLSRAQAPKQFQPLIGSASPLRIMFDCLRALFPVENIWVQTEQRFRGLVCQQLPEMLAGNLLLEPEARDTAPAFGYAAAAILERCPGAKLGYFYSDHLVQAEPTFLAGIRAAFQSVDDFPDHIVMLGVRPLYPHTGLGYIESGDCRLDYEDGFVHDVARFVEKPDLATARHYQASQSYLWNTGYKVLDGEYLLRAFGNVDAALPPVFRRLGQLALAGGDDEESRDLYRTLPRNSIEYVLTERCPNLLVVPVEMQWSDVGDWNSLFDLLKDRSGTDLVAIGPQVSIGTRNTLIHGGRRMVATIGLEDMLVVDTDEVLLIAKLENAQEIKDLVRMLRGMEKHEYL